MSQPLFSIIIPTFGETEFLAEAVADVRGKILGEQHPLAGSHPRLSHALHHRLLDTYQCHGGRL